MSDQDKKIQQPLDASNHVEKPEKTKQEAFAEDLIYTINHAIVCGTTDIVDPFIGAQTQKILGRRLVLNPLHDWAHNKFEHHDHDHDHHHHHHDHDHHHHDHDHHHDHHGHGGTFWGNLSHWVIGEAVGDVGAVPFTLAMQYYTPGIMNGIQTVTEPLLGPSFRWSANRYSRQWARQNGFDEDSPEAKARADELYKHEVEHLPHAFVWTGSAAGLNILTQKFVTKNKGRTRDLILGKAFGSIGTLGLVLGLRTLAPNKIQQLDEWNAENIAHPVTRKVSSWLGIDEEVVERVLEEEREQLDGHKLIKHHDHDDEHHHHHDKAHKRPKQHIETPAKSEQLVAVEALQSRQTS